MATDYDAPRKSEEDQSEESIEELKARRAAGGDLYFHRPRPEVIDIWRSTGFDKALGADHLFPTKEAAISAIVPPDAPKEVVDKLKEYYGFDQPLPVATGFALAPQLLAGARPVTDLAAGEGFFQRGAVHPGQHQHLAAVVLLGDGGDQAFGIPGDGLQHGGQRAALVQSGLLQFKP